MSNSRDYTITTLRNSVRQHGSASLSGTVVANNQVPFSFSPFTARIRDSGVPYVTGPETATDLNLRRTIQPGGGGGGGTTYITPFIYADFETSSSTTVTVTGSQPTYSGTLSKGGSTYSTPAYDGTNVFRGNYSLDFGNINSANDTGWVSFGSPQDRPEWVNLHTGSFSVSTWIRPTETSTNWQYDGIFWFQKRGFSSYNWLLVLGRNASSTSDGSLGWYVSGSGPSANIWNWFPSASVPIVQNQWNHIVYAIAASGSGVRSITAYINGNQLGTPYKSGGSPTSFSKKNVTDSGWEIGLGSWFNNGFNFKGQMDDFSVWDIELNSDQVNALYNGGSGVDVLTALTQSS